MRRPLLMYEALTNHIQVNNKTQQIKKTEMKQPQHMLFMKQPPVEHEVLIVTKTLYSDKDKEYVGRKTGVVGVNIYTERISGYLEGECFGRLGD